MMLSSISSYFGAGVSVHLARCLQPRGERVRRVAPAHVRVRRRPDWWERGLEARQTCSSGGSPPPRRNAPQGLRRSGAAIEDGGKMRVGARIRSRAVRPAGEQDDG